jgi:uncharacterized sulfatase
VNLDHLPSHEIMTPKRFTLLGTLACFVAGVAQQPDPAPGPRSGSRPNVLFIFTDDCNVDLGTMGHPLVQTPHLDRLARSGVMFSLAYCQYPLCGPSRASALSGVNPDRIEMYGNEGDWRAKLPADHQTLPQVFKDNGYFSARVGKVYHYGVPGDIGTDGADDPASWSKVVNPKGRDKLEEDKLVRLEEVRNLGGMLSYLEAEGSDAEQTDGMVASEAIKLIDEAGDRPFFIAAGFFRPHVPCVAPKAYFDAYPLDAVHLPEIPPGHLDSLLPASLNGRPMRGGLPSEALRRFNRAYYASISFMDAQVGRLLDALDEQGLSDNTIVVFVSDHGYQLGEHGQWQKMMLFDRSVRVPMMIRLPGATGNGTASPRTVGMIDLFPTLLEATGLTTTSQLHGTSLIPLLHKPDQPWNRPVFSQVLRRRDNIMGRTIRTERYRYTEWNDDANGVELYDYDTDPDEFHNRADDSVLADVRADLRQQLHRHFQRTEVSP